MICRSIQKKTGFGDLPFEAIDLASQVSALYSTRDISYPMWQGVQKLMNLLFMF